MAFGCNKKAKQNDMQKLSDHIDELYLNPKLLWLLWEATTRCNCYCRHCGSDCGEVELPDILTYDEICGFLKQVANDFDPSEIMLCVTGGEPLLRNDLFDVMSYAKKQGFHWGMTTNGALLTEEIVSKMIDTNCKTISVSLDGSKEQHNKMRGGDFFDKTLEGIRLLLAAEVFAEVQITTVIHKGNIHELHEIHKLTGALGADSWRLTSLEPIGRAHQMANEFLSGADYIELFDFIRKCRLNDSDIPVLFGCNHYLTAEYEKELRDYYFICGSGIYTASILYNGDIYGCLDIERKYGLSQGNIRSDRFTDIWENGFKQFRQRRDHLNPICSACPDAVYCRGDSAHTWDFDENKPLCCLKQKTDEVLNGYGV